MNEGKLISAWDIKPFEPFYSNGTVLCGAEPRGWYFEDMGDPPRIHGPFPTEDVAKIEAEEMRGE